MSVLLVLSCSPAVPPDAVLVAPKAAPRRPHSLGLDLPAVPGAYLDRDDDHDGWSEREGDCDDSTGVYSPRLDEKCNQVDDDCDGAVDEGCRDDWIGTWQFKDFHVGSGQVMSAEWGILWQDAAGVEWCRFEGPIRVEGPGRRNCPDCLWDFEGRMAALDATGAGCDRIDIWWDGWPLAVNDPDWTAPDTYSYGYALSGYDYDQWYNGRYTDIATGESVMLNMSLGWFTGWTNFDPAGRHEVFGDGTGNEVTMLTRWEPYWLPDGYTLSPE